MKNFKSPHTVEVFEQEEDDDFTYTKSEYCDGGDLIHLQTKQPNKVFTLDKAVEILVEVIKGVEVLHNA